jgi:lipopolysaccharide transport system permease protein/teichoic acid transport system permease protein
MNLAERAGFVVSSFVGYVRGIQQNRSLIVQLTYREFRARHLGSGLGLIWSFVHPGVMMTIYYLVFNYALHPDPINKAPFLVWLLAGMIPWFVISDMIAGGASSITDNRFLVKKVVFRTSLLPIVRLLSNLPVHLFLILVITGIFWSYGYRPTWFSLQLLYYLFALLMLALGWSLLMSAIVPFLKDVGQIVQVILQAGFWATPLIWNLGMLGKGWTVKSVIAHLNPICYIVEGYRDSMVYHIPFWEHPVIGAYYWALTLSMLIGGALVFSRLRSHFADVL